MLSNGLNQKDMTYRSMNRPRNSGFFVPIPERYPLMNEHKPNRREHERSNGFNSHRD